MYNSKERRRS